MFKKIGRKLLTMLLKNISEVTFERDPMGALRYSIKLRNPAENQNIENETIESKLGTVEKSEKTAEEQPKKGDDFASVSYEIASSFPKLNTRPFNFLTDWQVWFLIENHEKKRYKAYIKIKFIMSDGYEGDAGGYYGGEIAWRLNALSGIIAPGLGIPEKIREKVKQGKGIKIRILGEVKDENDNLIERKLSVEYIYDPKNNSWYLEP